MAQFEASFTNEGTFAPDKLLIGGPIHARKVTLTGGNYKRGSVLGRITASGKSTLSASAATDGSQTPRSILVSDADASGGDVEALVYETGDFNAQALILGAGHTIASVRDALHARSIFLHDTIA